MYKKVTPIFIFLFLFFLKIPFSIHAEDDSRFRFVVMGCMHFGIRQPQDYELAIQKIKEYNPDFVLFCGGMIDAFGDEPVESLWQRFDRITGKLGVPVYDIPSDVSKSCGFIPASSVLVPLDRVALMEKSFLDRYKKRYYSFEHKNNLFICLDSENEHDLIYGDQLNFLKKRVADVSKYNNVFVAIHSFPLVPDKKSEWFKVIHPLIERKVKYVFGAHHHIFDRTKNNSVIYITSGCPPSLPQNTESLSFPHFLLVEVEKKEVSIKVVSIEPIPTEKLGIYGIPTKKPPKVSDSLADELNLMKIRKLNALARDSMFQPNRIIETLKIKPGINILDIGAGAGYFTFPFADALKGEGKVFATDIDPDMVEYIKKMAQEYKYKNIFPVLVKREGVDLFYKQHSFDIIFLCIVGQYLWNPEYFGELKPSLNKNGRLYIINYKSDYNFAEYHFDNFKRVIEILVSNGKSFPIFQRLDKETQYFINNWRGNDVPSEIRTKIIQDFNKMLSDRLLFKDLMNYDSHYKDFTTFPLKQLVYPQDFRLASWLVLQLDEDGVFNNKGVLTELEKRGLHKLNKILLIGIFQIWGLNISEDIAPGVEKNSLIAKLKPFGYELVKDYDFLPQFYFLEFKKK